MMNNCTMKFSAVVLLLAVASSNARQLSELETTAYGYLTNIGAPEAERIRKVENELLSKDNRISGGLASSQGQIPWQAGLLIDLVGFEGNAVCGASLVTPNRLTTAAHCWYDGINQAWRFTVVLGSNLLFSGGSRIETSAVISHSSWFPLLARNDVAVIYLPVTVQYSATIQPIALPSGSLLQESFVGETAVVSGFGAKGSNVPITLDQNLSHVNVSIISNLICRLTFPIHLSDSNICSSGNGGTSPCGGDSGGPLHVTRNGEPVMIGIVSFGSPNGCDSGAPAVYARTTEFVSFFNQHLH